MITLNRRRVMGQEEDTYIQDGLIFWLDGIDKGNDPTAWTDLINGLSFPYNNGQETRSDSVYFNGNSGLTCVASSPSYPYNSCQVEVVVNNIPNRTMIVIPSKEQSQNIAFGFYDDRVVGCVGQSSNFPAFANVSSVGKMSYSLNKNYCYCNNVTLNFSTNDYWIANGNVFNVGCRGNDYKYIGNIYSIRIYNRLLTVEERIYNYNIDKQRFNI